MFSNNIPIIFKNNLKKVNKIIEGYTFIHVLSQSDIKSNKIIFQNIKKSNFMIINRYTKHNEHQKQNNPIYIVIGFKKTIIIFEQALIEILKLLITYKIDINICLLSSMDDIKHIFSKETKIIENNDNIFNIEIRYFNSELLLDNSCNSEIKCEWKFISPCISGYLIKESYKKLNINRLKNFINFEKTNNTSENDSSIVIPIIKEEEFIKLRNIGTVNKCELIYHIEREEIYVRKEQIIDDDEIEANKLMKREIDNYSKVQHPFLPKLIGVGENNDFLVIEYINGRQLQHINKLQFNFSDKITIFFEIMISIEFLHRKHFIYRDLKPNNVMIDSNQTAVLIDFDRMIEYENSKDTTTKNFSSPFCAPEVNEINFSYECDIYSLGLVYLFIMNQNLDEFMKSNAKQEIKEIISKSLKEEAKERPSIREMIYIFYNAYCYDIQINDLYEIYMKKFNEFKEIDNRKKLLYPPEFGIIYSDEVSKLAKIKKPYVYFLREKPNDVEILFDIGITYLKYKSISFNVNKGIHYLTLAANQNHVRAQFYLGKIYEEGELIPRDMNKSIYYLTLAANQNYTAAQYYLGVLYEQGKLITMNIDKSIHYYLLAANQNDPDAQFNLGVLYEQGKLIPRDINKCIHYYTLAANQNYAAAQFNLGLLYEEGKLIPRDIDKCIHYYTLAANQNYANAQNSLGVLYLTGELIPRDINKCIHYYTLAANQNHVFAQINLGDLYKRGELITRDMNKSIHYFTLAANQNDPDAQFNLGVLYQEGNLIQRDINKSIHYYFLAANQNYAAAQSNLGVLYLKGKLIPRDMNKSIYYLTLAADQNYATAQFNLGALYEQGKLIPRDINKSIHYLTLAANQNYADAQCNLGKLYTSGALIPRDINKGIHYLTLATKQNNADAQCNLGEFYASGEIIPRDINKSIHYLTLAAKQNNADAQYYLGFLNVSGESIPRDINKGIHYITLAANQNLVKAQFYLGIFYMKGGLIARDMNKSIHYYSLAANQNLASAQYNLGLIYISSEYVKRDVKKGLYYLNYAASHNHRNALFILALFSLKGLYIKKNPQKGIEYLIRCSNNGMRCSNFLLGYFYHIGKYVEQDIKKAIHYYKEASSFNYSLAKNNLGIIYKHGINKEVKQELGWAIQYFEEAIKYGNHHISMYNLAHLYFYENPIENSAQESIKLLIKSSFNEHYPSKFLLCIISIKEFGNDIGNIIENLSKFEYFTRKLAESIFDIIEYFTLDQPSILEEKYEQYRHIDYIFDFDFFFSNFSKDIDFLMNGVYIKEENSEASTRKDIDSKFYEGFKQ